MENKYCLKFNVIEDYFIFDENDIELYKLKKVFLSRLEEFKMGNKEIKILDSNFDDLVLFFQKNDFLKLSFPFLKNSVMGFIETLFRKLDNNHMSSYFFMLMLINRRKFSDSLKNYYLGVIHSNYFGILPKYSTVMTKDVMVSDEYRKFTNKLAEWYTSTEMIIFYITILNQYFNLSFCFDEKKYSLDNNFEFSIRLFAKKNFFKLASYICRKVSFDVSFGEVNYHKLFFLIASTFTCGLSFRDLFKSDIKQLAFLGGVVLNFVVGKIADKMDSLSNFVEFTRLEELIRKLNKKLNLLHKKLYELLKLLILSKIDQNPDDEDTKKLIQQRIDDLVSSIKKYFEGVDALSEETETNFEEESINIQCEMMMNTSGNDEWVFLNACKK